MQNAKTSNLCFIENIQTSCILKCVRRMRLCSKHVQVQLSHQELQEMVLEADIDGDGQVFCKIILWISVSYASRWQNHYLFHSFTFSGYLWGISSDDDCRVVIIDFSIILSLLNLVDFLHLLLCYLKKGGLNPGKISPKIIHLETVHHSEKH